MSKIEKRDLADIPDFIHEIMQEYFKDDAKSKISLGKLYDRDMVIAQYIDMAFRAGFESAKGIYKKR